MRFHSQNLQKEDRTNHWFDRRCWIYPFGVENGYRTSIGIQLVLPSTSGLRLQFGINDGDHAFSFSICVILFGLYVNIENPLLNKFAQWITKDKQNKYGTEREFGFYTYGDAISIQFWHDPWDSSHDKYKFQHIYIHLLDIFLGRNVYASEVLETRKVQVPMPEKIYEGVGTLTYDTWKRPRWFKHGLKRVQIEVAEGVPHPGKGTTAYNCGDDATFSVSCVGKTIEEGIGNFVGSVLNDRKRYPL